MAEQLTLSELIAALTAADQDLVLPDGFDNPHSYRGYYEDLAFEPASDVTVAAMLGSAYEALDSTYEGYKGGEYVMDRHTLCWIAVYGCCGDEDGLTRERLEEMLAAGRRPVAGSVVDRVESLIASTMDEVESIGETAPGPLSDDRLIEQLEAESAAQSLLRDELDEARAEIGRLRGQLAMHLTAWRHASRRARASRALRKAITADRDRLLEVGAATVATWRERAAYAEADRDRLAEENDHLRESVEAAKRGWRKDVDRVEYTRALLPEIDGTFRRLCERLSAEDQEALAEVYTALKHNLDAEPGT